MLSRRILTLRKQLGLTQTEFGKQLGVSRDVIGNIEYGRVAPKDVFLNHICVVFNVNPEWMNNGKGDAFLPAKNSSYELQEEALTAFRCLTPKLQEHALKQIKMLLELQDNSK